MVFWTFWNCCILGVLIRRSPIWDDNAIITPTEYLACSPSYMAFHPIATLRACMATMSARCAARIRKPMTITPSIANHVRKPTVRVLSPRSIVSIAYMIGMSERPEMSISSHMSNGSHVSQVSESPNSTVHGCQKGMSIDMRNVMETINMSATMRYHHTTMRYPFLANCCQGEIFIFFDQFISC